MKKLITLALASSIMLVSNLVVAENYGGGKIYPDAVNSEQVNANVSAPKGKVLRAAAKIKDKAPSKLGAKK
jgi:hypothetical protein